MQQHRIAIFCDVSEIGRMNSMSSTRVDEPFIGIKLSKIFWVFSWLFPCILSSAHHRSHRKAYNRGNQTCFWIWENALDESFLPKEIALTVVISSYSSQSWRSAMKTLNSPPFRQKLKILALILFQAPSLILSIPTASKVAAKVVSVFFLWICWSM